MTTNSDRALATRLAVLAAAVEYFGIADSPAVESLKAFHKGRPDLTERIIDAADDVLDDDIANYVEQEAAAILEAMQKAVA